MKRLPRRLIAPGLLAIIVIAACRTTAREVEPAGVGPAIQHEPSRIPAPEVKPDSVPPRYTAADVRFMQRMIAHHAQALAMTTLVPTRTRRDDIRLLAERIDVSQRDEIALVRQWLESRHQEVPSLKAHHGQHDAAGHQTLMPGMLTEEELTRLAKVTGTEFDRLFLQLMIRHHEGALTMVAELFGTNGAGQEPEIFRFASDVDADQRAEIARLRAILETLPTHAPPR